MKFVVNFYKRKGIVPSKVFFFLWLEPMSKLSDLTECYIKLSRCKYTKYYVRTQLRWHCQGRRCLQAIGKSDRTWEIFCVVKVPI